MQPIPEESEDEDEAQSVGRSKQRKTTDKQPAKRTKVAASRPSAAAAKAASTKGPTWK